MSNVQQLFNGARAPAPSSSISTTTGPLSCLAGVPQSATPTWRCQGRMSKPCPGPLSYTRRLRHGLWLRPMLPDFNLAYKKTFGNQAQGPCGARVGPRGRDRALPAGARGPGQPS